MAASRCLFSSAICISKCIKTVKFSPVRRLYSIYKRHEHIPNSSLLSNFRFSTCRALFVDIRQSSAKGQSDQTVLMDISPQNESKKNQQEEKEKEEKAKADANTMRTMKFTLYFFGIFFVVTTGSLINDWGSPLKDEEGNELKDEYSDYPTWKAYLLRFWKGLAFYNQLIKEPSRRKLLPDPLIEPYYQPKYTLVLEMTGVLVHPDWTYNTGWRFKKRPGIDYFLQQVGPPLFEVVIYTAEQGFTAYPIIESLDPYGHITYKLFRDATRYKDGHHVKDLDCLNRDLSKVILVDWNELAFEMHPRNSFKLTRWRGEDGDRTLVDLAAFLRSIANSNVDDVRTVLDNYSQYEDPIQAFKDNQKKLQEEEDQKEAPQKSDEKESNPGPVNLKPT